MDTYRPHHRATKPEERIPCRCHRCNGVGTSACQVCAGAGQVMAGANRNGHPTFRPCEGCFGRKTMRCPVCHGQLYV